METHIKFANHSYDPRTDIVFFQQDLANPEVAPVVWKVIRRCGCECWHPFQFSNRFEVGLIDPWGNWSKPPAVSERSLVTVEQRGGGAQSRLRVSGGDEPGVRVVNDRLEGSVTVFLLRNGVAVTAKKILSPGAAARFEVGMELGVLPWSGLKAGDPVPPAALLPRSSSMTFDLDGITSTELWMLGGGRGARAQRLHFCLQEIQRGVAPISKIPGNG